LIWISQRPEHPTWSKTSNESQSSTRMLSTGWPQR
jgi:hypothetical protein